jgi:pimeloyl-ACP methyl ester carboxylesterase
MSTALQDKIAVITRGSTGIGLASTGYFWMKATVTPAVASDFKLVKVENSGHFIAEERPEFVTQQLIDFFR